MRNSQIVERLYALQDLSYKEFHSKLVPNISPDKIIGVRTPELRKLSKELAGSELAIQHMKQLPHQYYEEDNLHGFFIEQIKDYEECIEALNGFLPYVDNWATCDLMTPKIFKKHLPKLLEQIKIWLRSEHTYMVRFGMKMLVILSNLSAERVGLLLYLKMMMFSQLKTKLSALNLLTR